MKIDKEPLYRKVNTRTHGVWHTFGSDAKYDRNTKKGMSKSMKRGKQRGLDYTPLFRFLLSKVGEEWGSVYSEAKSRLDSEDPIFWMIDLGNNPNKATPFYNPIWDAVFSINENAKFSKLIVDDNGLLQFKNPLVSNEDLEPSCPCCTHTFNGKVLIKKFKPSTP
jgi:flagellar capping protein FliD